MNNGVYGSPFPKLNPNIRYKTVFERAGFDVYRGDLLPPHSNSNYHHNHHTNHHHQRNYGTKPRSSSSSSVMPVSGVCNVGPTATTVKKGTRDRVVSSPIKNTYHMSQLDVRQGQEQEQEQERKTYLTATATGSEMSSSKESSNEQQVLYNHSDNITSKTRPNSNEELTHLSKDQNLQQKKQDASNSIEHSFAQLTTQTGKNMDARQSANSSRINSNGSTDQFSNIFNEGGRDLPSLSSSSSVTAATTSESSDILSQDPLSSRTSSTIASNNQHQKSATDMETTQKSSGIYDGTTTNKSVTPPVSPKTPTGASVEQLLAQLDKVSFTRNEKITETLHTTINRDSTECIKENPSPSPSTQTISRSSQSPLIKSNHYLGSKQKSSHASGSMLNSSNEPSYKKSSAYLSGFHQQIPEFSEPLSLQQPEISGSEQLQSPSQHSPSTPMFYSFKRGNIPSDAVTHVAVEGNAKRNPTLRLKKKDGTTEEQTEEKKLNAFKYPPGEGPCRLCGKEIVGKGIYSKKENELSGQWHRHCFKCCRCGCNTVFNKHIPCYILDDEPYCQQHYHEANHSICGVCKNWIEGGCLENDSGERFHVDCLKCFICKGEIYGDYFIFNDTIPVCSKHDVEVLVNSGMINGELGSVDDGSMLSKRRTKLIELA